VRGRQPPAPIAHPKANMPELQQPETRTKPFSTGYVLRTTAKHIRKSLDISIRKTFERVAEFDGDQEKSKEVFITLGLLHKMRKNLDDFQAANPESFKGA
jgi:hypothetical protein